MASYGSVNMEPNEALGWSQRQRLLMIDRPGGAVEMVKLPAGSCSVNAKRTEVTFRGSRRNITLVVQGSRADVERLLEAGLTPSDLSSLRPQE